MVKGWIGVASIQTNEWSAELSINEWWIMMSCKKSPNRKLMASLTMLVSWKVWKERNARFFQKKSAPPPVLLEIIKVEARLWATAGEKILSSVMLGE